MDFHERQARNRRATALLLVAFAGLFSILGAGLDIAFFGFLAGGVRFPPITTIALIASGLMGMLAYYHGGRLIMASLFARPLDADDPEHRELHNVVTEISIASGLPKPRLFVIPDPSPNALAAGRDPVHAMMALTEGALALFDREETQGVVAHEIAHIANRDTLVMTVVTILLGGVVMMADWARRSMYLGRRQRGGASPLIALPLIVLILLSPLLSRILAMAVSRQREYLADATAVEFTRNPHGLARALKKIGSFRSPLRAATRGTAHLFIADPLKRRLDERNGWFADLLSSHPPIAQRVAILEGMAGRRG